MKNNAKHVTAKVLALVTISLSIVSGCRISRDSADTLLKTLKAPLTGSTAGGPKGGPTKVVTDSTALALDVPESDLHTRERFRKRYSELIMEQRLVAADILVARNPDHAIEVLTTRASGQSDTHLALAGTYDRMCGNTGCWSSVVQHAGEKTVTQYFDLRSQWMGAVGNGRFAKTESIDLLAVAEATQLEALVVDAWYQTGIGQLLRKDNSAAADAFRTCADIAGDRHGMIAAKAMLLCSEARRRAEEYATATEAWNQAIKTACRQIHTRKISDPDFWDRAAYLQPIGTAWPDCVQTEFQNLGQSTANVLRTDLVRQLSTLSPAEGRPTAGCWVESAVGTWREARGETQKALIHLKKAETQASENARDWIHVSQAQLLMAMGQQGTAITLLAPIIAREDHAPVTLAAMCKLGAIKLAGQSPQHGVRLLNHAILESHTEWPGKSSSSADLALGMLMIGEKAEGISQLHQAQTQFEAEGEVELLAKALWNESKYLEHSDAAKQEIATVKSRLKTLQL